MAGAVRALREAGIADRLKEQTGHFVDYGDVPLSDIREDAGPRNLLNFGQFMQDTERIRSAVARVDCEGLMFGLGGECSICVGTLAGLKAKRNGNPGIVWIDAHGDFNTPETSPSGYIGGMCLAMACGRGPKLDDIAQDREPLVRRENVVHLGSRSLDSMESASMSSSAMRIYPASAMREKEAASTISSAIDSLAGHCDWLLCHLDIDSIDPRIMPAVNFPAMNGLNLDEIRSIVDAADRTGKMKLFELAGYNPTLDPQGISAMRLTQLVSDAFRPLHETPEVNP